MVEHTVSIFERVPVSVVNRLKENAKVDADFHREADEEFKYGHGPAVQKKA